MLFSAIVKFGHFPSQWQVAQIINHYVAKTGHKPEFRILQVFKKYFSKD